VTYDEQVTKLIVILSSENSIIVYIQIIVVLDTQDTFIYNATPLFSVVERCLWPSASDRGRQCFTLCLYLKWLFRRKWLCVCVGGYRYRGAARGSRSMTLQIPNFWNKFIFGPLPMPISIWFFRHLIVKIINLILSAYV